MAFRPGLEGVVAVQTQISNVDGVAGKLIFHGYHAGDLANRCSFEEVLHLLWYRKLPNVSETMRIKEQLKAGRSLSPDLIKIINDLPGEMNIMEALRTVLSFMGVRSGWPPTAEDTIRITAAIPTIIAYRYRLQNNLGIIEPHENLDHVANYLYMLAGEEPKASFVQALNAYFVLTAEHGMNAATFASRVIASTESDLYSAVVGAIGAMKGTLHGGAPTGVMDMLNAIGTPEHAEAWLRRELDHGRKLMGFGHRVYKTTDPRSEALRKITGRLSSEDPWFFLAHHVEETTIRLLAEYKPGRNLYTNVEFYAAAVFRAIGLDPSLFTVTFTASRVAGWIAHILEQAEHNRIFRPLSAYTGPAPV